LAEISALVLAIVAFAGAVAGCLGAMLGIGGGVFLIPFLNAIIGLPLPLAAGIGLTTVIATSSVMSHRLVRSSVVNLRLGMVLQIAASAGGYIGGLSVEYLPARTLYVMFSAVTALIAGIVLSRVDRRNVILDTSVPTGTFGGRFYEDESGQEVVYRTRRMPVALAVALTSGAVSGLFGIGGGILQVPALNAWCGVPLRAAVATSAVMIGITAAASAPIYYVRGDIVPPLAAAAVLGVLAGSRAGLILAGRARAKGLKLLMSAALVAVSAIYLFKVL
jgi:uncharacterized membrane protein YfcA